MNYRILNVGPDPGVRRLLGELAHTDGLVLHHIETGSVALEVLSRLPEAELPHLVIIPFRLPILLAIDFISVMHSQPQLRSIPILVWGPQTEAQEIDQMYEAGAVCVLLGQFGTMHLEAVRHLCRASTGIEPAATVTPLHRTKFLFTADRQNRVTEMYRRVWKPVERYVSKRTE